MTSTPNDSEELKRVLYVLNELGTPTRKEPRLMRSNATEANCGRTPIGFRLLTGKYVTGPRFCKRWHCTKCVRAKTRRLANAAELAFFDSPSVVVVLAEPPKSESVQRAFARAAQDAGTKLYRVRVHLGGVDVHIANAAVPEATVGVILQVEVDGSDAVEVLRRVIDTYHLSGASPVSTSRGFPELDPSPSTGAEAIGQLDDEELVVFERFVQQGIDHERELDPTLPTDRRAWIRDHRELLESIEFDALDIATCIGWE